MLAGGAARQPRRSSGLQAHERLAPILPITSVVAGGPTSAKRYFPQAVLATVGVMVMPALAVSVIETAGRPWLVLGSVLLAMALSVTAASVGSAIWMRTPGSRDLVFGDLMLWGWLRRVRAERRLSHAWELLEDGAQDGRGGALGRERRSEVLPEGSSLLEARDAYNHGHP